MNYVLKIHGRDTGLDITLEIKWIVPIKKKCIWPQYKRS